ncbi:MAG: ATP-binding protein [Chitinivibrionales bacterium]
MSGFHNDNRIYRVRRIRLVNFHNFQNETITVTDGGHLFLLGDNGSGKTTIIDAVHYVLTAGSRMELNSAARVGAKKDGGRRLQGIVMRYNVDTGPLNPQGGVSYAAVELAEENGSVLTVGIGMSTYSMDERIQRWGIIVPEPLEEVPWLSGTNGNLRVTGQREMREKLGQGRFYTIGAYEKELARRLFGGVEIFDEIARFVSMGKAYREIAAGAADYHELFKTLLPEPKTDLFDRIIDALRSLDDATARLEDMKKKKVFLRSLDTLVVSIRDSRESRARYEWLRIYLQLKNLEEKAQNLIAEHKQTQKQMENVQEDAAACLDERNAVERRLTDLQSSDRAGIVRQEKELSEDSTRAGQKSKAAQQEYQKTEKNIQELRKVTDSKQSACERTVDEIIESVDWAKANIGIDCSDDIVLISDCRVKADFECAVSQVPSDRLDQAVAEKQNELLASRHALTAALDDVNQRIVAISEELGRLQASDPRPDIPGLTEVLEYLDNQNIDANLLYELLEWSPGQDMRARAAAEELIGAEVLSTVMVEERQYEQVRSEIVKHFPGIRIAPTVTGKGELLPWVQNCFSVEDSHPAALVVLSEEMVSSRGPGIEQTEKETIAIFRAHERRLWENPSIWIGQDERRRARERRIRDLNDESKQLEKQQSRLVKEHADVEKQHKDLTAYRQTFQHRFTRLQQTTHEFVLARHQLHHAQEVGSEQKRRMRELDQEHERLKLRLKSIRELIKREGLEDLENRINELNGQRGEVDERYRALLRKEGELQGRIEGLRQNQTRCEEDRINASGQLDTAAENIRRLSAEAIDDIEYYVLRTSKGAQFKSAEHVENAIRDTERKEAALQATVVEKLNDPVYGAVYGFHYDEQHNVLSDRRDQGISQLVISQTKAIEEQQEVINEKTSALFQKIVINEMVTFFARHVSRLEQMVKTINDRLSRRSFGGVTYRLDLGKIDRYRPFIEAIKGFNPFNPATEEALKTFIEDHSDDILNADIEGVPAVLDYRNWFTYNLRMFSTDGEGVVIDRKTKSVGSGGEQAVPNYLTILTIAHFLFAGNSVGVHTLLFDEAFYGIDAGRRDQLLGFAGDMGLQILVASPDQDGVRKEIERSTTLLVVKDQHYDVHLYPFHWENLSEKQQSLFDEPKKKQISFDEELQS